MSIGLMSAIFETEFRDLTDAEGNVTKAATAKSVLVALADHANDYGEGAYPGLAKMVIKTALTKQCIINTYDALKYNGLISLDGISRLGTNNYTINVASFPGRIENKPGPLVISVDQGGNPSLPTQVISVDPNRPLTTHKPSMDAEEEKLPLDWQIGSGKEKITLPTDDQEKKAQQDMAVFLIIQRGNADLEQMARAFIETRGIFPTTKKEAKRWATLFREMKVSGGTAEHVKNAVLELARKEWNCADPSSVKKMVISAANPMPETPVLNLTDAAL